ncbi:MAG: glucosyl-dolichyl phosphate glucuronosyltransferase [Solirubrobacteraceae bacterium]|jgi:glycosyltransferase involved in cell wall biosynthesis|nr:glucosyl-dolichyl phosphate glucuronosyltransferase [Solirubrobacteraceae bacterium]
MSPRAATVVICAHSTDRWEVLNRGLDATLAQEPAPREVVVVVDDEPELLARLQSERPEVRAVANARTPGACGARNTGAQYAGEGEVLVFLDDDAVPEPGWLRAHLGAYDDPTVVGTGGPVLPAWRSGEPRWFTPELLWVVGCTWTPGSAEAVEVRNPIAANMTVDADRYRAAGGFDEPLGRLNRNGRMSGTAEETELAVRIARGSHGGRWVIVPHATVAHDVPASRGTVRYLVRRCGVEGRAKATLSRLDRSGAMLSSERSYVARDVPLAILRELRGVLRGSTAGIARATALGGAVAVTASAYAAERVRSALA